MDLYEEALYAQAVRERQCRVAMQREIELRKQRQIEAMMQRMAIESAMRDFAEREYQRAQRQAAWERKRESENGRPRLRMMVTYTSSLVMYCSASCPRHLVKTLTKRVTISRP